MISHASFGVVSLERAIAFYDPVLGALGYMRVWKHDAVAGYGIRDGQDQLALFERPDGAAAPGQGFHLAFEAKSQAAVDAFHAAALAHGGSDLGGPGLRPRYGASYYAAFVTDPDGYKLEALHQ